MPVSISTRAKKYLIGSAFYTDLEGSSVPERFREVRLSNDEYPIGVYENTPGDLEDSILITSHRVHFFARTGLVSFTYSDISSVTSSSHDLRFLLEHPEERKLIVALRHGQRVELPVFGSRARGADMAAFHSFLLGACQTVAIESQKAQQSHAVTDDTE